jgi:hypothetical protein
MHLRAINTMQVIGKTWGLGQDDISGLYMQRYPSQIIWSLATSFHLMDYDKDLEAVFGSTAVCRCIYSNEKSVACERFKRFRKSRNGRKSQDD